jgi:tetratricopeptide (TPR) repeat protein
MSNTRLDQILKMLETHPSDPFLHYATALEYEKLEQNDRAIEILEKLLLTQSDYLPTYYKAGQLHELIGNNAHHSPQSTVRDLRHDGQRQHWGAVSGGHLAGRVDGAFDDADRRLLRAQKRLGWRRQIQRQQAGQSAV